MLDSIENGKSDVFVDMQKKLGKQQTQGNFLNVS